MSGVCVDLMCVAWERGGWMEARKAVETGRDHRRPFPACFFPASLRGYGAPLPLDSGAGESGRCLLGHGMAWHGMGCCAVGRLGPGRGEVGLACAFLVPLGCPSGQPSMGVGIQTAMRLLSAGGCLGLGIQGRGVKRV